jgi:hypothetical protein
MHCARHRLRSRQCASLHGVKCGVVGWVHLWLSLLLYLLHTAYRTIAESIRAQVLLAGFELAIRSMREGTKRRVIVPPELGPPVGPSTFFSAKQCEVRPCNLR